MGYPHPHHREQHHHHELMQDAAELLYSPPGEDYRHQKAENKHQRHAPQRQAEKHTRMHVHNPAKGRPGALLRSRPIPTMPRHQNTRMHAN